MSFEEDCAFCSIARGEDPVTELIASDDQWIAFFPLDPATRGHTLIIPRVHVPDLWSADEKLAGALAAAVVRVGHALAKAVEPEGMNLITSSGAAAEQTVFHLHLHVVPRWRSDAIDEIWPPKAKSAPVDPELASRVRIALTNGDATA